MFHPSTISIGVPMQGTPNSCRAKRNRNPYKKGFSLRLVWCTNYIPFCHFRILFLWYLSPGSLSVPKVHMVGLILMTLKMYYINRLQGTIFLNVLSECCSLCSHLYTLGNPRVSQETQDKTDSIDIKFLWYKWTHEEQFS